MIARAGALLFGLLLGATALAAAQTADDAIEAVHPLRCSVRLDGVKVSGASTILLGDDGTLYVSAADLNAWNLKRPLNPSFTRDQTDYYGLQTTLQLAATFDEQAKELEITASPGAFIGQPSKVPRAITPGGGAFLNYLLARENQTYDWFATGAGGTFQMRYLSTTGDNPIEFHRARTRWFRLNPASRTILQLGDGTTVPGWLGTSVPFAGIHWASDFSSDPTFVPRGPPSVSGVADSPSLLEVYVDNILTLRRDVQQGPFTVRDLPASAANSDIVMVLTGVDGKQTFQVARPSYDPQFLGRGMKTFSLDAGLGRSKGEQRGNFYRGGVFDGMFRFGLTDNITAELYAESMNGAYFTDAGADVQLGEDETFGFRIGGGSKRHASQFEYEGRRGKFRMRELLDLNSLTDPTFFDEDFGNVVSEVHESTELGIDFSRNLSTTLRFDRIRENRGFQQAITSLRTRYRTGPVTIDISPMYDFFRRRMSGSIAVTWRINDDERLITRGAVNNRSQTTGSMEFRRDPGDPNDPLSYDVKYSSGRTQGKKLFIRQETRWTDLSFDLEQLYGRTIAEPELLGTLAFVGGRIYPMRSLSQNESFGVLHLPGISNVRVSVNQNESAVTDSRGDAVLRDLRAFRDNTVTVSTEDLPIYVNIADPRHVVPAAGKPVSLSVPILSRGGFIVRIVNDRAVPLDPGSDVSAASQHYPVGYQGRVFVTGLAAGAQQLNGTVGGKPCAAVVSVPGNVDAFPDLGTVVCR